MPKKRKKERIIGTHFTWLLGQRHGVYQADGRSNKLDAGRHSLGTRDYAQALENLKRLDLVRAVDLGLADRSLLHADEPNLLGLQQGYERYIAHVGRPRIVGGAKAGTI